MKVIKVGLKLKKVNYGNNKSVEIPDSESLIYLIENGETFTLNNMLFSNSNKVDTYLSGVFKGYSTEKMITVFVPNFINEAVTYLAEYTHNKGDAKELLDVLVDDFKKKDSEFMDYEFRFSPNDLWINKDNRMQKVKIVFYTGIKDSSKSYKNEVNLTNENIKLKLEAYRNNNLIQKIESNDMQDILIETVSSFPELAGFVKQIKDEYIPFLMDLIKELPQNPETK